MSERVRNMEFNEKLHELRKQRGLTQEELAKGLFVSRTAVSKWESGRGYPGIDSLKAIAKFFSVTVDELLSGDEILTIAEEDTKEKQKGIRELVFALLDLSAVVLLFLPFFADKSGESIKEVTLLNLGGISRWLMIIYFVSVGAVIIWGVVALVMQSLHKSKVLRCCEVSLGLGTLATLLFIICSQPYAAALMFIFMVIKVAMLIKSR